MTLLLIFVACCMFIIQVLLQSPAYCFSDNEDYYILAMLFEFSTSLGRFSQNFATRRGVSRNNLSPICVLIRALKQVEVRKTPNFCQLSDPKSTL